MQRHTIVIASIMCVFLPRTTIAESLGQFDGRQWRIGYDVSDRGHHVTEYVLPGQTVEAWRELITHQTFLDPQHRIPIRDVIQIARGRMGPDCKELQWTMLRENEAEAVYVWSHSGCSNFPPQYEVSRLARCPSGLCRWAYTTKEVPLSGNKQNEWRKIIEELRP